MRDFVDKYSCGRNSERTAALRMAYPQPTPNLLPRSQCRLLLIVMRSTTYFIFHPLRNLNYTRVFDVCESTI